MQSIKIFTILVLLALVGFGIQAEEGMWMPHQMKDLDLKALGLQMYPAELYGQDGTGLMSAIVHLGGGTAEFVSKQGLLLTNHHVAFGALQRASTSKNDYIQHGFLANTLTEEIPAPGYHADVLLGYEDVTSQVLAAVKSGMSPKEKYDALDAVKKKLVAQAEKSGRDLRANVANMYSGNQYYLYRFKRLRDLRLVYAPPRDLGNFGGDIDNWMWPRHTCDFTFLRAYVSPDDVGVDCSTDNIPYQPKAILKISLEGFKEGDFSFVMGYPGRTYRNYTLAELRLEIERMREGITTREDLIAFLEEAGKENRDIQIKYASTINGLNNGLKNYQGKLEGFRKVNLIDKKQIEENKFKDWLRQEESRRQKYAPALGGMERFMVDYAVHKKKTALFNQLLSSTYSSALLSQAYSVYRTALERQKPDMERESAYQDRNLADIRMRIELADRRFDLKVDRALLKFRLKGLLSIPQEQIPLALKKVISQGSAEAIDTYVDTLFDKTTLADTGKRLAYIEKTPEELLKLGDPMITLAAGLEKEMKELRDNSQELGQLHQDLKGLYLAALLEKSSGRFEPDANSTIRFTYGFFKGYTPRDAVYYNIQTTLGGVLEKETGEFPFRIPPKLKKLHHSQDFGRYGDKQLNDIPACFLNSTSVTGGNSGSPTLNAKGEQIGIIFDMTYESVTADYFIIPELQRTISVDIRYVLFVTEKFGGATHIIRELGF